ncbi:MAG: hypothetical protein AAFV95_10805 [Bacteroidota bacterium]
MKHFTFTFCVLGLICLVLPLHAQSRKKRSRKKQEPQSIQLLATGIHVDLPIGETSIQREVVNNGSANEGELLFEQDHFVSFGIAYRKVKPNKQFWTVEISRLLWYQKSVALFLRDNNSSALIGGERFRIFYLSTRLSYGKFFGDPQKKKLLFGIAAGLEPFHDGKYSLPTVLTRFPYRFSRTGAEIKIIPQLAFRLNDRLSVLAQYAPSLAVLSYYRSRLERPILTRDQQIETSFESDVGFHHSTLQLQIGLRLGQ